MNFTLQCSCGEQLAVTAIDAGRSRRCPCEVEYLIPRLTDLRRLEAEGATQVPAVRKSDLPPSFAPQPQVLFRYSEAEKLQSLVRYGRLPFETRCLQCDVPTDQVLKCDIECERPEPKRQDNHAVISLLIGIFDPGGGLEHYLVSRDEKPELIGKEVIVRAPLRVCAVCAASLRRNVTAVRELLLKMPLYQPLFRDYPEATVNIPNE